MASESDDRPSNAASAAQLSRRQLVQGAAAVSAISLGIPRETAARARDAVPIVLEDAFVRIAFDPATGAITNLIDKKHAWTIHKGRQSSALRVHLPLPDRRVHFLTEADAVHIRHHVGTSANSLEFVWQGFRTASGTLYDLTLRGNVQLAGGELIFTLTVDNASGFTVESVAFPILGDLAMPPGAKKFEQVSPTYTGLARSDLLPVFHNQLGYWGVDYPTQLVANGDRQCVMVMADDSIGLYAGYHDTTHAEVPQFFFELRPGFKESWGEQPGNMQAGDPANLIRFQINRLCFLGTGASNLSKPIVLAPFGEGWTGGAAVYDRWRKTWFKRPKKPSWIDDVHSWRNIQPNSAEDRLMIPYSRIVDIAKDCAKHGIKVIQVIGWNVGGQDRGNPSHDIDPRLGTHEELRQAIADSRALGVEIVLFNKYTWADLTTDAYRSDLHRLAALDPYGIPYHFPGYSYDTPTQLSNINTRRFATMCMASQAWRDVCLTEFKKSVDLGSSGILFDEAAWHGGTLYCFAKDHGHPVPTCLFTGDNALIDTFRKHVDEEQFLFSGESPYDLELTTYSHAYTRIGPGHVPFQRYLDPELPIVATASGWDDRQMINRCLMYRYSINYEPHFYKGELSDIPLTVAYGKKVDDLRRRYRDYLWAASFLHHGGISITVAGKPYEDYAVFRSKTDKRAIVLINASDTEALTVPAKSIGNYDRMVTPDHATPQDVPAVIQIAPASAVVLLGSQS